MSSLENGMRVLKLFSTDRPMLRVNELSVELDLPKSSVSRLLSSLADFGFVEKDPSGGYRAGISTLALRESYFANHSLYREVDNMLTELTIRHPFTALAAILSRANTVLVNTKQGTHPLRVVQTVGTVLPAEETVTGLCLLARMGDHAATELLRESGRSVEAETIQQLDHFRAEGYVYQISRRTKGIASVGSSMSSYTGDSIAFCLTYPILEVAHQEEIVQSVLEGASEIGRRFGDAFWENR